MPATYEPIATTTLGSAASTITFSSIPGTYTDLRIVFCGNNDTTSGSSSLRIRFNSDTGSNYSDTYISADGNTVFTSSSTNATSIRIGFNLIVNNIAFATADIFSYSGSTNKTVLGTGTNDGNGNVSAPTASPAPVSRAVGLWRSTSAITSLVLFPSANNFQIGTTATIYGILKA